LNTTLILFICLNFQLSYSQDVQRTSEIKRDVAYGQDCDDTEYRNEWGSPNWKNYGMWLSECDSIRTVNLDREFADRAKQKKREQAIQDSIDMKEALTEIDNLNLDAMWEQAQWEEIQDVTTEVYETEYITAVAGVRGAEAEDEALAHLYYRKSMKGISLEDYKKAYGKLKNKRDELFKQDKNHIKLNKIDKLLSQLKIKIKNS